MPKPPFRQLIGRVKGHLATLARASALIAFLCVGADCSQPSEPCPEQNLVIVVNLPETVKADELLFDVLSGQTLIHHGSVPRPPKGNRGRIEVGLGSHYVPGIPLRVHVSPVSNGARQGRSNASVTLAPVCSRLEVTVTNDSPEPDWSCIGMVDLVTYRTGPLENKPFHFADMFNEPIPPATLVACADLDPECQYPVWRGVSKNGVIAPEVGAGFEGFFTVEVSTRDYYPVILDMTRAVSLMNAQPVIVMLKPEILRSLAAGAGDSILLAERGSLTLATFDCRGYRMGGIAFKFKATPVPHTEPLLYILANNWYPDRTLEVTDSTGTAFIANLPAGVVRVTAILQATGKIISEFNTRIMAGAMTYVAVEPN